MTHTQEDDPFTWDMDCVVQELCTMKRTCKPTPRATFPEPTDLESRLRTCHYNGKVLLTSLDSWSLLWANMGIQETRLKMTIRTAIYQFRVRSASYQVYKKKPLPRGTRARRRKLLGVDAQLLQLEYKGRAREGQCVKQEDRGKIRNIQVGLSV
ncbi:hypothetical protein BD289DRAFT_439672 [Coniella lustricola]|uniref:Uncharacterized protein n=1 Tax=Coniella lustricola TaxID=2025994 RepID=A0A2T3A1B8_9PEZI|nr:hypothetical protein BD289DRAFT_439672 [Coniella lustricola]